MKITVIDKSRQDPLGECMHEPWDINVDDKWMVTMRGGSIEEVMCVLKSIKNAIGFELERVMTL